MNSCWGYPARFSTSLITLFQIKTCHTRFQAWPLKSIPVFRLGIGRNYVIIYNKIKTLTKRFLKSHFEFAYYSFFHFHLKLKPQIVHTLPYSLQNHTRIQTKISKVSTRFQNQNGAKTIPFGATHASLGGVISIFRRASPSFLYVSSPGKKQHVCGIFRVVVFHLYVLMVVESLSSQRCFC